MLCWNYIAARREFTSDHRFNSILFSFSFDNTGACNLIVNFSPVHIVILIPPVCPSIQPSMKYIFSYTSQRWNEIEKVDTRCLKIESHRLKWYHQKQQGKKGEQKTLRIISQPKSDLLCLAPHCSTLLCFGSARLHSMLSLKMYKCHTNIFLHVTWRRRKKNRMKIQRLTERKKETARERPRKHHEEIKKENQKME